MTRKEAADLMMLLMAKYPQVIRPNSSESFQKSFINELYGTYEPFEYEEVRNAILSWAEERGTYPSDSDIKNQIYWEQRNAYAEPEEKYSMDYIDKQGYEWSFGNFTREQFIAHPRNKDRLQPEEWHRRFMKTYWRWHKEHGISGQLDPEKQRYYERKIAEARGGNL